LLANDLLRTQETNAVMKAARPVNEIAQSRRDLGSAAAFERHFKLQSGQAARASAYLR